MAGWMLFERAYLGGIITYKIISTVGGIVILFAGMYFGRNIFPVTEKQVQELKGTDISIQHLCITKDQLLSAREVEILMLTARGHTNEQISKELFISVNTVKTHLANVYAKLDVKNRTSAFSRAKELGILL
jgi:ATP/maltotriose-dependent transcriptional regulator MalT